MNDWRILWQDEYLSGETLLKISFPDFWNESFATQNDFFLSIKNDAEKFVNEYGKGAEYLRGELIQDFWHAHCDFCTEKILTRDHRTCYCTRDFETWICEKCFNDFHDRFGWKVVTPKSKLSPDDKQK